MAKKVMIDCDVGVDDALALILAFHSPELEVQAVTGVKGNVPLSMVFRNIQKVLSLLQPSRRPWIAEGADRPLTGEGVYAHEVHGEEGLGGALVLDSGKTEWWRFFPRPAHQLICELAAGEPGALTLIALGPLTNVALALDHDPEAMKTFQEIIVMGGAVRTVWEHHSLCGIQYLRGPPGCFQGVCVRTADSPCSPGRDPSSCPHSGDHGEKNRAYKK